MIILRLLAGLTGLAVSEGMKRSEIRRKADIINARYYENKRKEEERRAKLEAERKRREDEAAAVRRWEQYLRELHEVDN